MAKLIKIKEYIDKKIQEVSVGSTDLTNYYTKTQVDNLIPSVPTALSSLSEDATHRLVTDTEKSTWNNKLSSISKANVEAVLTGEISTHTHAVNGLTQAQALTMSLI